MSLYQFANRMLLVRTFVLISVILIYQECLTLQSTYAIPFSIELRGSLRGDPNSSSDLAGASILVTYSSDTESVPSSFGFIGNNPLSTFDSFTATVEIRNRPNNAPDFIERFPKTSVNVLNALDSSGYNDALDFQSLVFNEPFRADGAPFYNALVNTFFDFPSTAFLENDDAIQSLSFFEPVIGTSYQARTTSIIEIDTAFDYFLVVDQIFAIVPEPSGTLTFLSAAVLFGCASRRCNRRRIAS